MFNAATDKRNVDLIAGDLSCNASDGFKSFMAELSILDVDVLLHCARRMDH
jgi:hypothetical protein